MTRTNILVAVAACVALTALEAQAALVGHWPFDNDFTDAVGPNDGVVSGAGNNTAIVLGGILDGAASFDGNKTSASTPRRWTPCCPRSLHKRA